MKDLENDSTEMNTHISDVSGIRLTSISRTKHHQTMPVSEKICLSGHLTQS